MKRRKLDKPLSLLLVCLPMLGARAARAEPSRELSAVEEAYRAVDFEAVLRLAEAAIRAGGNEPSSMARLEFLRGVASAALARPQQAQTAFIHLLGIDPNQKLERELSPRLRAPYLEARGFWSSNRERLSATARLEAGSLRVALGDPAKMVHRVRVSLRRAGTHEFHDSLHAAAADLRVALPSSGASDVEAAITLVDEFGNSLHEQGTKLAPLRLERTARAPGPAGVRVGAEDTPSGPSYLLPSALSVLGLASAVTGVTFHVQRERAAREWNGRSCERPGSTREQQCGDVERRITRDEWLSVGFYAGAGALLTLGVVGFIANRGAQRELVSGHGAAPAMSEAVSCDAALGVTLGVSCAGRF
jgi:hypothetical protein